MHQVEIQEYPMKLWTKKAAATVLSVFCLLAFSLGLPSMSHADLPSGVIALSDDKLPLPDAEKFCWEQGGKLPFVNNTNFLEGYSDENKEQVTIDGFANIGAPWPEGLPDEFFWTGTRGAKDNPDLVYLVSSGDGHVRADIFYDINYKELTAFAACVPSGYVAEPDGPIVVINKDQAEAILKAAIKDEAQAIEKKGGKPGYVYVGEGVVWDVKAWFFNFGVYAGEKFTAEQRFAVNERGEWWGKDPFGKWIKISE
jgi:hypothetical protein